MAMIYCSACGKQISDKASVCPHCNTSRVPAAPTQSQAPTQPQYTAQQPAANGNNKTVLIVGIIVSALLVALIVVILIVFGGNSGSQANAAYGTTGYKDNYVPASTNDAGNAATQAPSVEIYNVDINVNCRENLIQNKYDVNILIDGKNLATLKHGDSAKYPVQLEKGSHTIEFRIASKDIFNDDIYSESDRETYQEMYISVTDDMSISYYVELTRSNSITVTQN